MTYRIKDWDVHYENHDSRKVKSVRWVALPNKHDGKGYRRVAASRDAIPVMCAWPLIVQVASKMPVRGVLADEDGPLDSSDLSAMTGFPAEIFDKAFKLLVVNKIGWLEVVPSEVGSPDISREFPQSPDVTGEFPLVGKGMEGNGREDKSIVVPASPDTTSANETSKFSKSRTAQAVEIFDYWKLERGRNNQTIFDDKRKRAVEARLKAGYDVDFIKQAIRGIKHDPHCMGENDAKKIYDDLELICRDSKHLEGYAALDVGSIPARESTAFEPAVCRYCHGKGMLPVYDFQLDEDVEKKCPYCSIARAS